MIVKLWDLREHTFLVPSRVVGAFLAQKRSNDSPLLVLERDPCRVTIP